VADDVAKAEGKAEPAEGEKIFVPYFRAGTADLNTTLALGTISMVLVQIFGVMHLGVGYLKKFINFAGPIDFFVGILELVGDFSKIISFAFRLFGNIFAGEVLLVVITSLTKVVAPMPFYGLELFVGFIQALVFSMLSVVLYNMATLGHGDHQ
jgi:F-type H+-transporting ATPase subunit a